MRVLAGLLAMASAACCLASPDYRFQRLSLEQGLSQSSVLAMAEGPLGYLWFGTEQGADRFDGYRIQTLRHAPQLANSLGHSRVGAFHTDSQGRFWIGTQNGLNRVSQMENSVQSLHLPDSDEIVPGAFSILELRDACGEHLLILSNHGPWLLDPVNDRWTSLLPHGNDEGWQPISHHATDHGEIWLANLQSLWRLDCSGLKLEQVARYQAKQDPPVSSGPDLLDSLPDGRLLWASEHGLRIQTNPRDPHSLQPVAPSGAFAQAIPRAIHVDQRGRVWGMLGNGVVRMDGRQLDRWTQAVLLDDPLGEDRTFRLESAISGDGVFWLAGLFGLAAQSRADQGLQLIEHDPGNPYSIPRSFDGVGYRVLADRFGVVWIGANLGGLARYVPSQHRFEHVAEASIGANNVVRGVIETGYRGRELVWVGIEFGGVRVYDRDGGQYGLVQTLTAESEGSSSLPGNRVVAMARQPRTDFVWVLGSEWLVRLDGDPEDPQVMTVATPPGFRSARHLAFSRDGRALYVTTSDSIWRLSAPFGMTALERFYRRDPREGNTEFTPILELSSGQLAVGCRRGLNLIDPGSGHGRRISLFPTEPFSTVNFVFSLHESADGWLWMGTHGGGLASVAVEDLAQDHPPIQWLSTDDGLADNTVYAILGDRSGCLWLTGNRGISHFCPEAERVRNFSLRDGLQEYEFNGRVADIGASGRFYFGGINGFNVFRPESIDEQLLPPLVRLQEIRVDGQPVALNSAEVPRLNLSHRANSLDIDYLALHYVAPEAIEYAYRLVGMDEDWVDAGTIRRARYPGLPSGEYRFQVRAANSDGIWSEPQTLLAATIQPPPWRTWPAYAIYLLAIIGLSWAIAWSVIRRRRELEAKVDRRTHELAERNQTVIRQAAELEGLLRSRQALYANVSHEFRTPLTLILAGLDRLKRNPNDAEAVELGERYVRRLDRLVDQLLDLSRVSADAFEPEASPWMLTEWLGGLVRDHTAVAEDRKLHLDFVAQGEWQTLCNRELIEKCLTNLLSNAFKYTPPGGQIIVRLGGSSEQADIEVTDTGRGIRPEDQANIFERFQRLPAHENQPEKGAGIGLALVCEAATALGGQIRLESQPGKGSRFTLTIPARQVC